MSGNEPTTCNRCPAREPDLLDAASVAERVGLSPALVRQLVAYRATPHIRLDGGRVRFRPRDVDAWAALCGHRYRPVSEGAAVIDTADHHRRRNHQ